MEVAEIETNVESLMQLTKEDADRWNAEVEDLQEAILEKENESAKLINEIRYVSSEVDYSSSKYDINLSAVIINLTEGFDYRIINDPFEMEHRFGIVGERCLIYVFNTGLVFGTQDMRPYFDKLNSSWCRIVGTYTHRNALELRKQLSGQADDEVVIELIMPKLETLSMEHQMSMEELKEEIEENRELLEEYRLEEEEIVSKASLLEEETLELEAELEMRESEHDEGQ